ncbi:hypothetical protein AB832_08320 [Flavobacteriaceae bacterium (ex Bugula neritina AB1)]|nr:hypothetical protein AB832_08320 [Flavobacteriaceae bacterium (ex Bugula neritina AB1)]
MRGEVLNGVLEIYFRISEEKEVLKVIEILESMNYYLIKFRKGSSEFGSGCAELLREQYTSVERMKKDYLIAKKQMQGQK